MQTLTILAVLMALLLIRVPVAFALGGLGAAMLWLKGLPLIMTSQFMLSGVNSFEFLAVPLFLLMSHVLLIGGHGAALYRAVQSWVGHWPGGLGVATILTCAIFAAVSGSSVATAATVGSVAIGEMTQRGYPRPFVLGMVAAGGTLGILIPPSIPMIIYAITTDSSVTGLFLAGIGPGLFLSGCFILYCFAYSTWNLAYHPSPAEPWGERFTSLAGALPVVFIGTVIMGGIYGGVFTPTEAAGVGFIIAFVIVAARREASVADLRHAALAAMSTTVAVLLIVAGAKLFGKAVTIYQIPQEVTALTAATFQSPWAFLMAICAILLLMGLFLESLSMILIIMPVLLGSLGVYGFDPIWFGIVFVIMIECALITPPVGMNLVIVQSVAKAPISDVIRGVWPFVLIMLFSVVVVWFVPGLAMWLPGFR